MKSLLCTCLLLLSCGDNVRFVPTPLDEIVNDYEDGTTTRDEYLDALAQLPDDGLPGLLVGSLRESRLLVARAEPYRIESDYDVSRNAVLVLGVGARLEIAHEATVDVFGRLYAVGTDDDRISIFAAEGDRYTDLLLHGGPNQLVGVDFDRGMRNVHVAHHHDTTTLIEDAEFNSWDDLAIAQNDSSGLHVLRSRFGYDTPADDVSGESIRTRNSGSIIIEECSFSYRTGYRDVLDLQDCDPDDWPIVLNNTFDGGEDDAVDLDNCSAIVVGNHIRNFRPIDLQRQEAGINGGGVTGDGEGSTPFIANNIIDGCFHGIGFKNGAKPNIVNNTIINNNIGITLYQSDVGNAMPDARIFNNVLENNLGWLDGGENEIVLNGKWWPSYNQVDDVQAIAEVRYNSTATLSSAYPGEGNNNLDPLLDNSSGLPRLSAGSPAIGTGLGVLALPNIALDRAMELLASDFEGMPRELSGTTLVKPSRGALEPRKTALRR